LLIKCRESGAFTFHLAELRNNTGPYFEMSGLSISDIYSIQVATELAVHTTPDTHTDVTAAQKENYA